MPTTPLKAYTVLSLCSARQDAEGCDLESSLIVGLWHANWISTRAACYLWLFCSGYKLPSQKAVSLDQVASSTRRQSAGSWRYKCVRVFVRADKATGKVRFLWSCKFTTNVKKVASKKKKDCKSAARRIIQARQSVRVKNKDYCSRSGYKLMRTQLHYPSVCICLSSRKKKTFC